MNPVTKWLFSIAFVVLTAIGGFGATSARAAEPVPPIRGVWVAGPQHNLFWRSPNSMAEHMTDFKRAGINTVYLATLNHGRTYYPSLAMKHVVGEAIAPQFAGRDPLAEAIAAAVPHGIRVIAWLEFGFASHHGKSGHENTLLSARPHWAALNRRGEPVVKNQFHWMNAFDPEVQAFMTQLCVELVRNYPGLSGIQGDDRLPALPVESGHNPAAVAAFTAATGKSLPASDKDPAWVQWRADQLTAYLRTLRAAIKAQRSGAVLSSAPSPYPWGFTEYLQDWPAWLRKGLVDELIPQLYRRDAAAYERLLKQTQGVIAANSPRDSKTNLAAGVLLSLGQQVVNPAETIDAKVKINRDSGMLGEVFFHSIGVGESPKPLGESLKLTP